MLRFSNVAGLACNSLFTGTINNLLNTQSGSYVFSHFLILRVLMLQLHLDNRLLKSVCDNIHHIQRYPETGLASVYFSYNHHSSRLTCM